MNEHEPQRVELDAAAYDERWRRLRDAGHDVHGEAALVQRLLDGRRRVLDAGCGTGRVAIRLAELGCETVGVDLDPALLSRARTKAPALTWCEADLAHLGPLDTPGPFDAIVMAGNVLIFVASGTERSVVANLAARLAPGGVLVAGFQLVAGRLSADDYDDCASAAGLVPVARFSTWSGDAFARGGDYLVAVDQHPDPATQARSGSPSLAR